MAHLRFLVLILSIFLAVNVNAATVTKGLIGEQDIYHFDGSGTDTFSRLTSTGSTLTLNKVGSEVDALIVYGGGVNYNSTTINAAILAIGSTEATLLLRPGTWVMNANITVPANIVLKVAHGGVITTTGYTLTINGPFNADDYRVFVGTGTVLGLVKSNLCWFGGSADGATTDFVAAMKSAVVATATGGTLIIPSSGTTYYKYDNATNGFTDTTIIDRSMTIQVDGTIQQTGYAYQDSPAFMFYITADYVTITGRGTLQGPGTYEDPSAPATRAKEAGLIHVTGDVFILDGITLKNSPQIAIYLTGSDFSSIRGCKFLGGPLIAGAVGTEHFYVLASSSNMLTIENNHFARISSGCVRQAIFMEGTNSGIIINDNVFYGIHEHSVYCHIDSSVISNNIVFYSQAAADQTGSALKVLGKNNAITGNAIYGAALGGITLMESQSSVVSNNTIYNHGGQGIAVYDQFPNTTGLNNNIISNNTISGLTDGTAVSSGIEYSGANGLTGDCFGGKIINNTIYKSGDYGILLRHIDTSKHMDYFDVSGNTLIDCNTSIGIIGRYVNYSRINDNLIVNLTGASAVGIVLGETSTYNEINSNRVIDNQAIPTLTVAVYYDGTSATDNTANGNYIKGATQANVSGFSSAYRNYVDNYQPTPVDMADKAPTLTIANLMSKIITGIPTTGRSYVLPTGTLTDAGVRLSIGEYFDWSVINLAAATHAITLVAGVDHTIVGSAIVEASSSAKLRTTKTGSNTFTTYRID